MADSDSDFELRPTVPKPKKKNKKVKEKKSVVSDSSPLPVQSDDEQVAVAHRTPTPPPSRKAAAAASAAAASASAAAVPPTPPARKVAKWPPDDDDDDDLAFEPNASAKPSLGLGFDFSPMRNLLPVPKIISESDIFQSLPDLSKIEAKLRSLPDELRALPDKVRSLPEQMRNVDVNELVNHAMTSSNSALRQYSSVAARNAINSKGQIESAMHSYYNFVTENDQYLEIDTSADQMDVYSSNPGSRKPQNKQYPSMTVSPAAMFTPTTAFMSYFDALISIFSWFTAFMYPFGIGLGEGPLVGMPAVGGIVCAIYGVHAVLSYMFPSYTPGDKLAYSNISHATPVHKYGWRNFVLDVACAIPFDAMLEAPIMKACVRRGWPKSKAKYATAIPGIITIFRLYKARRFGGGIRRSMYTVLQLFIDICLMDHMWACAVSFCSVVPFLGEPGERDGAATFWSTLPAPMPAWTGDPNDSITDPALHNYVRVSSRYISALYYSTWNFLCVGMGDCKGVLNSERLLTTTIMITGGMVLAYTAGMGTSTIQFVNQNLEALGARSRELTQWVECRNVHPDLVSRLNSHVEVSVNDPTNGVDATLDEAPKLLKKLAIRDMSIAACETNKLLKALYEAHPPTMWQMLTKLRMSAMPAGVPILRQGDPPEQIALLMRGVVNTVYTPENSENSSKQKYVLGDVFAGQCLGLAPAFLGKNQEVTSLSASYNTTVLVMESSDFMELVNSCPPNAKRVFLEFCEKEELAIGAALRKLKVALPTVPELTPVQLIGPQPWARLVSDWVIRDDQLVPFAELPDNENILVSRLTPAHAKAVMSKFLTARYALSKETGMTPAFFADYFGLRPKELYNKIIYDVENDEQLLRRGILSPSGFTRTHLNFFMALAVIYTSIVVPLYIGFDIAETNSVANFNHCIDALFFFDIVLTMRTAILIGEEGGDGRLNTMPWDIFWNYCTGNLFLDLMSTLPFESMSPHDDSDAGKLTRVIRLIRLTRLMKLARLSKLARLMPAVSKFVVKYPREMFFMSAIIQIIFMIHLLACAFVFVIVTISDDKRPWWASYIYNAEGNMYLNPKHNTCNVDGLCEVDLGTRYLAAFYWATSTATTTGVGDVAPFYDQERFYNSLATIIGVVFYAYIAGLVAGIVTQGFKTAVKNQLASVDYAARRAKLSVSVRRRLNAYHRARLQYRSPFDEGSLLGDCPFTLRKDLTLFLNAKSPVCAGLTSTDWKVPSGAHFDSQFVYDCALVSNPRWAELGEVIAFKGDAIDEVLIIETGEPMRMFEFESKESSANDVAPSDGGGKEEAAAAVAAAAVPTKKNRSLLVVGLKGAHQDMIWKHDVVASTPCFLWSVSIDDVKKLAEKYPAIARAASDAYALEDGSRK